MQDRAIQPKIKDAVDIDIQLKPFQKITLDNGIPVYYINAGAEEVLMIEAVFYAGNEFEHQNLVANATNFLLKNGTSAKSAFQINEFFEYYGAYLNRSCHNQTANVTLHCLSKFLTQLLPVFKEILTDPAFAEQELNIFKQNSKQQLSVNLKKCDFVANRLIDSYLFGKDHPYGKYSTAEAYDNLNTEVIKNFFKNYYQEGKCIVFVAGKLPADFESQLNKTLGTINVGKQVDIVTQQIAPSIEKKYRIENDQSGVQGAIRIGRHFPNRHHPDYKKVVVLNTVLGGFFGSRLMDNIREDKGYTYGIHSFIPNHVQQTSWMISTEAGRDVCEATINEIYKEMDILKDELIDEEELLLVKNYMIGSCLSDIDGPFHIINRWKNIILHGLKPGDFDESIQTIKNVTAVELKEMSEKYLNKNDFYELIVY